MSSRFLACSTRQTSRSGTFNAVSEMLIVHLTRDLAEIACTYVFPFIGNALDSQTNLNSQDVHTAHWVDRLDVWEAIGWKGHATVEGWDTDAPFGFADLLKTLDHLGNGQAPDHRCDTVNRRIVKHWSVGVGVGRLIIWKDFGAQLHIGTARFMVSVMALIPDGKLAFSSLGAKSAVVHVWELSGNGPMCAMYGHTKGLNAMVALSNDRLASASSDHQIRIWNLVTYCSHHVLKGHTHEVLSLVVLRNGFLASAAYDDTVRVWNLDSGVCLCALAAPGTVALGVLCDGSLVSAANSRDSTNHGPEITVWDTETHSQITKMTLNQEEMLYPWLLRTMLVICGKLVLCYSHERRIRVWE